MQRYNNYLKGQYTHANFILCISINSEAYPATVIKTERREPSSQLIPEHTRVTKWNMAMKRYEMRQSVRIFG